MDHEIIEQVLYDPTGSTRRDPLRRITMTYALDSGEGEWMKTSDKVNAALREALVANHAVGLLAGTYDEALTITRVSDYLLHLLDYSLEEFREISGVSLGTLFGRKLPLFSDRERFAFFQGRAEAVLMMKGGLPLKTYLYKMDTVREDGERIWILSVQASGTLTMMRKESIRASCTTKPSVRCSAFRTSQISRIHGRRGQTLCIRRMRRGSSTM